MADKIVMASVKDDDGNEIIGKRTVEMYNTGDDVLDRDANQGLTLRTQNSIRGVLRVKHGLITKTSGGKEVDTSKIEEA